MSPHSEPAENHESAGFRFFLTSITSVTEPATRRTLRPRTAGHCSDRLYDVNRDRLGFTAA